MPEIPDLETWTTILNQEVAGLRIEAVEVPKAIVLRAPPDPFAAALTGREIGETCRRGKFLVMPVGGGDALIVNGMLTGRLRLVDAGAKRAGRTCLILTLSDGRELRYVDHRYMGRIYWEKLAELQRFAPFVEAGPDALDPALTQECFLDLLSKRSGQVKNVLTNQKFIAGIGNAYADEILFVASIHPFTKVSALDEQQRRNLYRAIHLTFDWAIPMVATLSQGKLGEKPRAFLQVHRKGGDACPHCEASISEVSPNNRVTSFCRNCQPG